MTIEKLRELLEQNQIFIYFGAVVVAAVTAMMMTGTTAAEGAINPALAFMLFVTFLQVPLAELGQALKQVRFLCALLIANFVLIPLLVFVLVGFFLKTRCFGSASCWFFLPLV